MGAHAQKREIYETCAQFADAALEFCTNNPVVQNLELDNLPLRSQALVIPVPKID
jgi:hypothetical protein